MRWYNWILCLVNKERREALHKVVEEQRKKDRDKWEQEAKEYCKILRSYGKDAYVEEGKISVHVSYSSELGNIWKRYASLKEAKRANAEWLAEVAVSRVKTHEETQKKLSSEYDVSKEEWRAWKAKLQKAYSEKDKKTLDAELKLTEASAPAWEVVDTSVWGDGLLYHTPNATYYASLAQKKNPQKRKKK